MTAKKINLALQGGGAHGAFTWGVLDRILDDSSIEIEGISGASAGAMNAVVLAHGYVEAGRAGAKKQLKAFWEEISNAAAFSPIQRTPIDVFMGNWSLDNSFGYQWFDALTRLVSPYEFNPLNYNPLLDVIRKRVDFDKVQACTAIKLFISATNVNTGRIQVFDSHKLTAEKVMASACLPLLFQAIEIDGVPYWDGGYMGNPALFPLFETTASDDILIVQINPIEREGPPKSAREIIDRVDEINFNSSLLRELRAIDFVARLKKDGKLDANYRHVLVHRIENQDALKPLGASSKVNAEMAFLNHLRDVGYQSADSWIKANWAHLGEKSTLDLPAMLKGTSPDQS